MSKKFFYSTDWHARGKSPSSRTDDYPSTIENKIRHFFRLGEEYGVDAYICGGDMVDTPYLSPQYVNKIGVLISEELDKRNKKMYYVLGNHDIIAYNPQSIEYTSFGIYLKFNKNLVPLSRQPIVVDGIELSGIHSYAQLDKNITDEEGNVTHHRSRDWIVTHSEKPRIHVVHGFLSPKPILEEIPHTLVSEIEDTKSAVTLCGHDHTGFPVTKLNHGLVYNPGALGRVFASHTEMNRMPKYALITIHTDGTPEIEPIACPVAELGEMVFNRSMLDEKKRKEQLLLKIRSDAKEVIQNINIQSVDLYQVLNQYKEKTSRDVYDEVLRRLQI